MGGGAAAQALALASGREDKGKKRAADEGGRDEVRCSTRLDSTSLQGAQS